MLNIVMVALSSHIHTYVHMEVTLIYNIILILIITPICGYVVISILRYDFIFAEPYAYTYIHTYMCYVQTEFRLRRGIM